MHSTGMAPQALATMARICCQSNSVAVGQSIAIDMRAPSDLDALRRLPYSQMRSMNASWDSVLTSSVEDAAFIRRWYHVQ